VFRKGDIKKIDLKKRIQYGLVKEIEIIKNIEERSMVELDGEDVVRSPLVKKIVQAYENDKSE